MIVTFQYDGNVAHSLLPFMLEHVHVRVSCVSNRMVLCRHGFSN